MNGNESLDDSRVSERASVRKYDLEKRTAKFAEAVIDFVSGIRLSPITSPLVSQLIRAATSIGANYCEADDAESSVIFDTRSAFVVKRREKQSIGFR